MRRFAPLLLVALTVTACGSTVRLQSTNATTLSADQGLGAVPGAPVVTTTDPGAVPSSSADQPTDTGTAAVGPPQTQAGGVVAPVVPTGGSSRSTTAAPAAGSARTSAAAATKAGASAAKTSAAKSAGVLTVGLVYPTGVNGAASALGIKGLDTGDTQKQAQALADSFNKAGGILGRPITIVPAGEDAQQDPATAQQAACSTLTQDHHVNLAITINNAQTALGACLKTAGVPLIADAAFFGQSTAATLKNTWFGPGDIVNERLYADLVNALSGSGWLTKKNIVGIFSYDDADGHAASDAVKATLGRLGIAVGGEAYVSRSTGGTTEGGGIALKFSTAKVDRIFPVTANPLFLMEAASTQGYHPEYALNSEFGPGGLLESSAPADQLAGASGIGWQPGLDIGAGTRPTDITPSQTACLALMKAAGQASTSSTTQGFQEQVCDMFYFLRDAATKGGGVTGPQLTAGAAALGTSWVPASTFQASFPSGRADGAAAYRLFAFDGGCSCFQYTSGVQPLP